MSNVMIEVQARDWHLLRLYVAKTLPEALVKPRNTPGWRSAPASSMSTEFLDPLTKKVKVPTRESFVGRRRQLQNCLRALTQDPDRFGVLIHGMGGLGKSSLAARLCDRLPQFKRLVWQGRIDPAALVNHLADALKQEALRQQLKGTGEDLKYWLRGVFEPLAEQGEPPFLLILDDFEENLEARGTGYVLKAPAAEVLQALIWAMRSTDTPHRLILTSRYDFELQEAQVLYRQPMDALQGADLRKKCSRLSAMKPPALDANATDEAKSAAAERYRLQEQAKQLADGNPRLLEQLNDEVLAKPGLDPAATLEKLAADPTDLRQQVIEERVLHQLDADLQTLLSRGLVFELPVPRAAFATVTLLSSQPPTLITHAVALGVLEASPDETLRVPRLLPLSLPKGAEVLNPGAAQSLYRLWWETDHPTSEEQALENIRLPT